MKNSSSHVKFFLILAGAVLLLMTCGREGPEGPPDTTPPTIVSTSPVYGAQQVPLNLEGIDLVFNEEMSAASVNAQTLTLRNGSGALVEGTVTCSGSKVCFIPAENLAPNTIYTLTVSTGVQDVAGNPMVAPYFCTFTTGSTTADLTVTPWSGPHGTISPATPQVVKYNGTVAFTITPDSGYSIVTPVGGTCGGVLSGNVFTTNAITGNCRVEVEFTSEGGGTGHTVTATASARGSIAPSGSITAADGSVLTFTVTPDSGYHIASVVGCGGELSGNIFTTAAVTADCTVTANFSQNTPVTHTITATPGSHGSISPSGTVTVPQGDSRTFTITPDSGYAIQTVTVDGNPVGSVSSYTFANVTANHTISATFAASVFLIQATAGDHGEIEPEGNIPVPAGGSQTFEIDPDDGYIIAELKVDGSRVESPSGSYTFSNVRANHKISVTFKRVKYSITAIAGDHGSITPTGTVLVDYGTDQTFSIMPDPAYSISSLLVDNSPVPPQPTFTFQNVTADHLITASFKFVLITHTITASADAEGTIVPAGQVSVPSGASQSFTISPLNERYRISDVQVDNTSVGIVENYTFPAVSADHVISAFFEPNSFTISAGTAANGRIICNPSTVLYGGDSLCTIIPESGYSVLDVLADGISAGPVASYLFPAVEADHTISAIFSGDDDDDIHDD